MERSGKPTLFGERVVVRPARDGDEADRLGAGYGPELSRMYGGDPRERRSFTPEAAARWRDTLAREPFAWAVEHEGRCIGTVRLHSIEWASRAARLAIGLISPATWGRGLGSEAIRLVLRCAFEGLGLHRVGLRVLDSNERAMRAYTECGFVREGYERETVVQDGVWRGDVIMGCLDRDYWARFGAGPPADPPELHRLFDAPILGRLRAVPEGWDGSSRIELVRTAREEVAVRWSGVYGWLGSGGELPGPAWWGCNRLFGVDGRRVFDLAPAHELLAEAAGVPVPRLLGMALLGGWQCAVLERMPGVPLGTFAGLADSALEALGAGLAHQHAPRRAFCGTLRETHRVPLAAFHDEAAAAARAVAVRFWAADGEVQGELDSACRALAALPEPEDASPVILDHSADQYLVESGRVTALVDLEMAAFAPRALDLVALELEFDERTARAFRAGYASVTALPDLRPVRRPYRYLVSLLMHHGEQTLSHWLSRPALLDR